MRRTRIFWFLGLFLVAASGLAACGDATATAAPATTARPANAAPGATTAAAATTAASAANPVAAAATNANAGNKPSDNPTPAPVERMVIRNASLLLNTQEVEPTLTQLRMIAVGAGGLVFQENTSFQGDKPTGMIVLQVPSQKFEEVITKIRQLNVKVMRQETGAQDVTEEFVDVRSQITNLQRTEEGLQKLIDKAQRLEEVLSLQRELTSVRGEIEKRQGRINFLSQQAAFSTIKIEVAYGPVVEAAKVAGAEAEIRPAAPSWQPEKIGEAWNGSLRLLGSVATALIQIVVFCWWLVPFLLVGLIWWRVKRAALKKPSLTRLDEQAG